MFAGFIGPHKGVDVLLDAWRRIGAVVDSQLVIAGGPGTPDAAWLLELERDAAGLANPPRFLGHVPDDKDFQGLINGAAMVVLPYRSSSPASGVLARAMAAGRAVVATRVPAASAAIVSGENGVLVAPGDPDALADAILGLWRSPGERDRLGAAAARTARTLFSWSRHLEGLERAYAAARDEITG